VKRFQGFLLATPLKRVRAATYVFGVVSTIALLLSIDSDLEPGYTVVALIGVVSILTILSVTAKLGRLVMKYDGPALAVGLFMIAVSLHDAQEVLGAILGLVAAQSLYGSWASAGARIASMIPVIPLAVLVTPSNADTLDAGQIISASIPIALFGLLMQMLKGALEEQENSNAREQYLARLSQSLLGTTSYEQILKTLRLANDELVAMSPGLVSVPVNVQPPSKRHPRGSAQMMGVGGAPTPSSRMLPPEVILPLEAVDLNTFPAVPGGTEALEECELPRRQWYAYGVDRESSSHDSLGVNLMLYGVPLGLLSRFRGAPSRPRTELMDAVRSTQALAMMAKRNTRMYMEMSQQSRHDALTALPNRSVLFNELNHAIDMSGPGDRISALIVDLDDFKRVNDLGGHAAGDALLAEVAHRISSVVSGRGIAARFGGDEFAVLFPQTRDLGDIYDLAEQILHRIAEPVQLAGGTVRAAASIGVAITGDGITGGDLLRCADIAMYAAKANGKGQIDVFSIEEHGTVARTRRTPEPATPSTPS